MSKRSFRRLAAVTGAALAIGSMAPAMAARVGGNASVSVDPIDITDVTSGLPPVAVPTALVTTLAGSLVATAQAAPVLVLNDVTNIVGDALGLTGGLLGTSLAGVGGTAGIGTGPGGVTFGVGGTVPGPLGLVGGVAGAPGVLVGDALGTVGDVAGLAAPVALGTAGAVAGTALGTVSTLPGTVLALPGGLLTGGLNGLLGNALAGNVNVVAGVMGAL